MPVAFNDLAEQAGQSAANGCRIGPFADIHLQAREVYMERMIGSFLAPREMGVGGNEKG
jgi:hypothetical protein